MALGNSCWMRLGSALALVLVLTSCANKPYTPSNLEDASFLERSIRQTDGPITVTVAVPDAVETAALFGLNLYEQGIQPVWLEIQNAGPLPARVATWSIDPEYFSPLEVAWMNRAGYSNEGERRMERWFYDTAIRRRVPPGEQRSGFVYTHYRPGTKGFNLDVFTGTDASSFTFFVPIPGFTADYMLVDFSQLYTPAEIMEVEQGDLTSIRRVLESMPCCSTDSSGAVLGAPFNVLLVGSGVAVRRMLLRVAWLETRAGSLRTAAHREHRYRDRPPDGIFYKVRPDGNERRVLRLWLSPYRYGAEDVWLGQVSYDLSDSTPDPADYISDPDVDKARNHLFQEVWYSQSLKRAAFVGGVPASSRDIPTMTFDGSSYFSDGLRSVLFLSDDPVAAGDAIITPWRQAFR